MPGGPGTPNHNLNPDQFDQSDWDDFSLPPDKEAYYKALDAGAQHREAMKGMDVRARHEYVRGLREGLQENDRPKRGDFDNPLRKDMPKEPPPPRAPKQRKPPNPMVRARQVNALARKARGRRR